MLFILYKELPKELFKVREGAYRLSIAPVSVLFDEVPGA
jgi:hypothetical protein